MTKQKHGAKPGVNTFENFRAHYAQMISRRAVTDADLIPVDQAIGYYQVPGTNFVESITQINLDVAVHHGKSIAWTVAEGVANATTADEAQAAILDGVYALKRIPNFDRACAAFVLDFITAYEAHINAADCDGAE